jgi:hypothetical protein
MVCGPVVAPQGESCSDAMAKGRHGDYYVPSPILHLNGLTARLIDLRLIDLDEDPASGLGGWE